MKKQFVTQEIIEGNKLIAEFMGWTETDNDLVFNSNINGTTSNSVFSGWVKKEQKYTQGVPLFVVKNNRTQIDYMRKNLKYHSSWDWLMPCIGKISNVCEEPEELDGLKYALLTNNIEEAWDEEYFSHFKGNKDWVFTDESKFSKAHGWCNNFKGWIPYRYLIENKL